MKNNKYAVCVLLAGTLWGFMGFFRRSLDAMGISASGCIAVRCVFATVFFALTILLTDKSAFKIKLSDLWVFMGTGVLSLFVFGVCYFKAMDHMSLSAAAILLYTAPCFVILLSVPLFGEGLDRRKIVAMLIAFGGCCLVSGIASDDHTISLVGVLLGLASGICYALYSIFSRFAINKGYGTLTINFYSCLLAAIAATAFDGGNFAGHIVGSVGDFAFAAATGLVTCYLPYMLYTYGLTGMQNGKASIMASIEPVVATFVGVIIYKESLTVSSAIGVILVITAIVILNIRVKTHGKTENLGA